MILLRRSHFYYSLIRSLRRELFKYICLALRSPVRFFTLRWTGKFFQLALCLYLLVPFNAY